EPAAAMHEHAPAMAQQPVQHRTAGAPARLEAYVGRTNVDDRKMVPVDAARHDLLAESRHAEHVELVALDQRDHRVGMPARDGVEVRRQVALPVVFGGTGPALAGAERDADPSPGV